jgi:hypothetical protein
MGAPFAFYLSGSPSNIFILNGSFKSFEKKAFRPILCELAHGARVTDGSCPRNIHKSSFVLLLLLLEA